MSSLSKVMKPNPVQREAEGREGEKGDRKLVTTSGEMHNKVESLQ